MSTLGYISDCPFSQSFFSYPILRAYKLRPHLPAIVNVAWFVCIHKTDALPEKTIGFALVFLAISKMFGKVQLEVQFL